MGSIIHKSMSVYCSLGIFVNWMLFFSWIWYSGDGLCGARWDRWNVTAPTRWMGLSNWWAYLASHRTHPTGWYWLQAEAPGGRSYLCRLQVSWPEHSPLALRTAALQGQLHQGEHKNIINQNIRFFFFTGPWSLLSSIRSFDSPVITC
jgi:hypothetical protein